MSSLSTWCCAAALLALASCKKDEPEIEAPLAYKTVSTLAGNGTAGYANGTGTAATFEAPEGIIADGQGNVYVADAGNHCIRKITAAGVVSTFAGTNTAGFVNGTSSAARFNYPMDVAIDREGNLYVADSDNNCVRKITPAGVVSTFAGTGVAGFADGPGNVAQFNVPNGITVDGQGVVYVSDYANYRIRKIMPNGTVSTLAGTGQRGFADGPGSTAQFDNTEGLTTDSQGVLFVAEFGARRVRRITPSGVVSTFAGTGARGNTDGPGSTATFVAPSGVAFDAQGNLFVADTGNNSIRKITPAGEVSTLTGRVPGYFDGPVASAGFDALFGIAAGSRGTLYVTEYIRIRKVSVD